MARKKEDANPLCGIRLKELLKLQNMTQKDLANRLNYTEQHISLIARGKRRMTLEIAQDIVNLFPDGYRTEWLMGHDDCQTVAAYNSRHYEQSQEKCKIVDDFIKEIAKDKGYEVDDSESPCLRFISKNGINLYDTSLKDYNTLCMDVCFLASFCFDKMIAQTQPIRVSQELLNEMAVNCDRRKKAYQIMKMLETNGGTDNG